MLQPRFKPADNPVIQRFLTHCHRRRYPNKSVIIYAGDQPDALYYITQGSVAVVNEDDQGREIVLAYLNAGDFFGEMGLFDNERHRSAWVRARASRSLAGSGTSSAPPPTATQAPTSARTIEWQNASACSRATSTPSASRDQPKACSSRIVVDPARGRQYAAQSCSPASSRAAASIAVTSSSRGHATVKARASGSCSAAASAIHSASWPGKGAGTGCVSTSVRTPPRAAVSPACATVEW